MIEIQLSESAVPPYVEVGTNGEIRVVMDPSDSLPEVLDQLKGELDLAVCQAFTRLWSDPNFPRIFTVGGTTVRIQPNFSRIGELKNQSGKD